MYRPRHFLCFKSSLVLQCSLCVVFRPSKSIGLRSKTGRGKRSKARIGRRRKSSHQVGITYRFMHYSVLSCPNDCFTDVHDQ